MTTTRDDQETEWGGYVEGPDGRYLDFRDVAAEDVEDLTEDLKETYICLGKDERGWDVVVGMPRHLDIPGFYVVPLATLVRDFADELTPGEGSEADAWEELSSLAAHIRALADEIDQRVKNRDTTGWGIAWGRVAERWKIPLPHK